MSVPVRGKCQVWKCATGSAKNQPAQIWATHDADDGDADDDCDVCDDNDDDNPLPPMGSLQSRTEFQIANQGSTQKQIPDYLGVS